MSERIPRDLGTPFGPPDGPALTNNDLALWEGFAADVPRTDAMIDAANGIVSVGATRANLLRVEELLGPRPIQLLQGLIGGISPFPTPDRVNPTPGGTFRRAGIHDVDLPVPLTAGGATTPVNMWSIRADENNGVPVNLRTFPAATIRVREGQIVHTTMNSARGPHTVHHHGIEPTPMNDGVGHLGFEIGGGAYTYQWRAAESGTYFYHCHRNTVLHFERGMYGMLIVDPDVGGAPFTDGGPGVILVRDTPTAYQSEVIWVADDVDARWHGVGAGPAANGAPVLNAVDEGLQAIDADARSGFVAIDDPQNPRLHDFRPNIFMISGVAAPLADDGVNLVAAAGRTVTFGQRLLIRLLNASYCTQVWRFPTSLQGTVTAMDGRTLGRTGFGSYSQPFSLASIGHEFTLTTARRWDVLVDTSASSLGTHLVAIEFRHHITNALLRTLRVPVTVAPA